MSNIVMSDPNPNDLVVGLQTSPENPRLLDICNKLKANKKLNEYNINLFFLDKTKSGNSNIIYIVRKGKSKEDKLVYNPNFSYSEQPITFCFELKYEIFAFGLIHRILVTPVSYDDNDKEDKYKCHKYPIGEGQYCQEITFFDSINIEEICKYIITKEKEIIRKNDDKTKYIAVNQHYCAKCKILLVLEPRFISGHGYL